MELPNIDTAALPDTLEMTGVFGTGVEQASVVGSYDGIVVLMTFIYDLF